MDKLKSKKFWALVIGLVCALVGGGGIDPSLGPLDPLALGIAGLVSTVYIIVQGRVDRASALAKAVEGLDLEKVKELLLELTKQETKPPPSPTILPPPDSGDQFPY